ncbi:MAG: UDP-N-acetylmuramate dehydrogenase [Anaerolineales bacterium]
MSLRTLQARALRILGSDWLTPDEPLAPRTSFRIGGPALLFASPPDVDALRRALAFCADEGIPWFVMGRGTNLLVSDAGYSGMVIHMGKAWAWLRISGSAVDVGAGYPLPALARKAADAGLSGLEFAAGIPGSTGGAIAMNAGAFGGSMAQVVCEVDCILPSGEARSLTAAEMAFAYRHSRALAESMILTGARLLLAPDNPDEIRRRMADFQAQRKARQPLSAWSAGSVFRNPPGDAAGRLIEAARCKGLRQGGALVSPKHANFIVNTGGATAADVLALMREVQRRVEEAFGVRLEPEIKLLGEFDAPTPAAPAP